MKSWINSNIKCKVFSSLVATYLLSCYLYLLYTVYTVYPGYTACTILCYIASLHILLIYIYMLYRELSTYSRQVKHTLYVAQHLVSVALHVHCRTWVSPFHPSVYLCMVEVTDINPEYSALYRLWRYNLHIIFSKLILAENQIIETLFFILSEFQQWMHSFCVQISNILIVYIVYIDSLKVSMIIYWTIK